MSLETKISEVVEHIATEMKELKDNSWKQVAVWETNTLTWAWIWIDTTGWNFNVWVDDWL